MSVVFDIEGLPPEKRLDAWRTGACRLIHPMLVRTGGQPVRGRVVTSDDLGIRTIRVTGGASTVERPSTLIQRDEMPLLQLTLLLDGRLDLEQGDTGGVAVAGDLAWYATAQSYRLKAHGDFDLVHVLLPGRSAALVREVLGPAPATPLGRDTAATRLVASFVRGLVSSQAMSGSGPAGGTLESALLGVIGALPRRVTASPMGTDRQQVLVDAAVRYIRDHLCEPALTPARIAAAVPVSVRYLHILFAQRGQSVSGHIREERLLGAARDLADPRHLHRGIGEIGRAWGFVSPAHFTRVFAKRFACTPGTFRVSAM